MNEESIILLTINLEGVLGLRAEKECEVPASHSYYLRDEKGNAVGKLLTVHNKIMHRERENMPCMKRIVIRWRCIEFLISDKGILDGIDPFIWKKMTKSKRIAVHMADMCKINKGISFSYEIVV